jgi:chromosome segregation ATPase
MKNNNNINNDKTCNCKNKKYEGPQQSYSYYSRLLNKPFDRLIDLEQAEAAYIAEQKAKEDKTAQKKADAAKVDGAFKELNAARKEYKDTLIALTEKYSKDLKELKAAFDADKNAVQATLAAKEDNYAKALREFTEKYDSYHLTLRDGDFETTISSDRTASDKTITIFDLFDSLFNF